MLHHLFTRSFDYMALAHLKLTSKAVCWLIFASISLFSLLLFVGLGEVPSPLFQDEADGLYRILHFASTNRDVDGSPFPILLSWRNAFGSFSYPAYFIPVALFSKLLGGVAHYSELRAVGGIFCVLSALMTYKLARLFNISPSFSLLSSFLYISSPLSQLSYRVAWDPVSFPFFYLVAVYMLELLLVGLRHARKLLTMESLRNSFIAGLSIGFLWWGYPPGRLISILLITYLFARLIWIGCPAKKTLFFSVFLGWLSASAPILWASSRLQGSFQRSADLLNKPSLLGVYSSLKSLLSQLTYFDYLIFWGDPQRRHSTGFGGVLGFAGIILLVVVVAYLILSSLRDQGGFPRQRLLADPSGRIVLYIVFATIPSAITFDEFHALRSNGAFPFWSIFASLLLMRLLVSSFVAERTRNIVLLFVLAVATSYGLQGFNYMSGYSSFLSDSQQNATYRGQSREYFQRTSHDRVASLSEDQLVKVVSSYSSYPGSGESRVLFEYFSRRLDKKYGAPYFP